MAREHFTLVVRFAYHIQRVVSIAATVPATAGLQPEVTVTGQQVVAKDIKYQRYRATGKLIPPLRTPRE